MASPWDGRLVLCCRDEMAPIVPTPRSVLPVADQEAGVEEGAEIRP